MSEYNKRTVTGLGAEGKRMREMLRKKRSALRGLILPLEEKLAEVVRECPGLFGVEADSHTIAPHLVLDEKEASVILGEKEVVPVTPVSLDKVHECIVQFKVRDGKLISYGLTGCKALGGAFIRRMPEEEDVLDEGHDGSIGD